jgi:hypothetical protein
MTAANEENLPIFEAPDGFRIRAPWGDSEILFSLGYKHIPKFEDCPQCGGIGKYSSEAMARYEDEPCECERCAGSGKVVSSL